MFIYFVGSWGWPNDPQWPWGGFGHLKPVTPKVQIKKEKIVDPWRWLDQPQGAWGVWLVANHLFFFFFITLVFIYFLNIN
jgi:hypothetical protein